MTVRGPAQALYSTGDYARRVPTWHVEESAGKVREIVRLLVRNHLAPATVGDIGCGAGEVLRLLQFSLPPTCQLVGYDISPHALAAPRANDRLRFVRGDMPREPTAYFDLLLVLDVLEHLEDYFCFLRELRPKGDYKVFFFPLDLSIQTVIRRRGLLHTRDAYGHLHYFTKEIALRILADTGYTVIDSFYTSDALDLPTRLVGRNLLKYPRKLLYAMHRDFAARLLGGYRLLVLAQ